MKTLRYDPLNILCHNGWEWHLYIDDWLIQMDHQEPTEDEYYQYTLVVMGHSYNSTVRAVVAAHSRHLIIDGHYGVLWLDVAKYENDPPYEMNALTDMIRAIEYAEDNLLNIGMPFTPDYRFHKNAYNKKLRNDKLRRRYNLDALEKEDREKG